MKYISIRSTMENHEEDDLEELRSTVYTFPPDVQNVIEQVRLVVS